jgi:hypothetical protein
MSEITMPGGRYTLWTYYGGGEGWQFKSFDDLKSAVEAAGSEGSTWVIQKSIDYQVQEILS